MSYGYSRGPSGRSSQNRNGRGNFSRSGRGSHNKHHSPDRRSIQVSKYIAKAMPREEVIPLDAKFTDYELHQDVQNTVAKKGYVTPSPIQHETLPHALKGVDIIGLADTGTGKTAAFLLPILDKIVRARVNKVFEKAIIIAPTRELAQQIERELIDLTNRNMDIFSVLCVGGMDIRRQIQQLRNGADVVIGTPGRLGDLIDRRLINLKEYNTVVLDEVDRMLDMGFVDEITKLLAGLPPNRHSLFFSATMPRSLEGLVNSFLNNPTKVQISTAGASQNVNQDVVKMERGQSKPDKLISILKELPGSKSLIFCQTKHFTETLSEILNDAGLHAEAIHGDRSQGQRTRALRRFRENDVRIMVATDVAARGIDIKDITHVINYDEPNNYEDYIHRVGRAGRAGKEGHALTFIN
jgi:ATP-dependent RNA helicase RhlE